MPKHSEVKPTQLTRDDLKKMTTHQFAELLANISLVLRRLPDVLMSDLERPIAAIEDEDKE